MSHLVYGIVFASCRSHGSDEALVLPAGVGGAPVRLIEEGSLAAAVSTMAPGDTAPNVARALSFSRVVEALHSAQTVLPMRYGCVCRDEAEVVNRLRGRAGEYAAILRRLDGCAEMGVRILLPLERTPSGPPLFVEVGGPSGRDYLMRRAATYAHAEAARCALAVSTEHVRQALGGLAVRTAIDHDRENAGLSTVHFLVRRASVELFRAEFRRIERMEPARLLLSGPWPPSSFAVPEQDGSRHD
ncbi:MAG: GvpL/GvpF family gas vesicle protein [Candidatus Rokubacteria bacterium]|nr:GvpL/GvpF family gas vesicle protein [Candidatus Rokubacteria bacterium]